LFDSQENPAPVDFVFIQSFQSLQEMKLDEARYFLGQMKTPQIQAGMRILCFNFSAFLSAARTVLQYIHAEAQKGGNIVWYQRRLDGCHWCAHFRKLRNLNIHHLPTLTHGQFEFFGAKGEARDNRGMIVIPTNWGLRLEVVIGGDSIAVQRVVDMTYIIKMDDTECNLIDGCDAYLSELEEVVVSAVNDGIVI
jgi:hypothetical protein